MSAEPVESALDSLTPILVERHAALLAGLVTQEGSGAVENPQLAGAIKCLGALEGLRQSGDPPVSHDGAALRRSHADGDADIDRGPLPHIWPASTIPPGSTRRLDHDAPLADDDRAEQKFDYDGAAPVRLGKFQIVAELGRGAHGVVYRARDLVLHRDVALKIPRLETLASPDRRLRFLQESRAVASLSHPHIVPVFECGEVGPACFIASEYCSGPTLAAWLKVQPAPVAAAVAAEFTAALADAVAHVHSRGILHRDIKPGNVLLDFTGGQSDRSYFPGATGCLPDAAGTPSFTPILTDFGLAKLLEASGADTQTGAVLGTPQYMAPEQAQGRIHEIGTACDIYALGVILYELLIGRTPFAGSTPLQALHEAAEGRLVPPRQLRPEVSRDLQAVCLKCLEFDPAERYPTALALRDDLRHFLAGEPVSARESGQFGRLTKWARRSPLTAGLATTAVLITIIGFVAVTWQWRRAERFRGRAEDNLQRAHQGIRELHEVLLEGKRSDSAEFQTLRRDLMRVSLRHYLGLLDQKADDTLLRADIAETCYQIAMHSLKDRDWPDAAHWFEQGISIWRSLLQQEPESRKYRDDLSKSLLHLAKCYEGQGRIDEVQPQLLESIRIRELVLVVEGDRDAMFVGNLADAYCALARSYRNTKQFELALKAYDKARDWRERTLAIDADPHLTIYRVRLSRDLLGMAYVLYSLGRPDEALHACRQAREIQVPIYEQKGDIRDLAKSMLETLCLTAHLYDNLQQPGEAEKCRQKCERMVAAGPQSDELRRLLQQCRQRFEQVSERTTDVPFGGKANSQLAK